MDINKAKRLLAKINVLVENFDDAFSTLENDLLKTYIKELYECVSTLSDQKPRSSTPLDSDVRQDDGIQVQEVISSTSNEATQIVKEEKEPVTVFENTITKSKQTGDAGEAEEMETNTITEELIEEERAELSEENPVPEVVAENHQAGPEIESLFTIQKGGDLLSKLGAKPVGLIENAMGINERIFTINELFGGDQALFKKTVDYVNSLENFEQAKQYLITGIALEKNWVSADRSEKAIEFIQLIQRKFHQS